ncbi:hypothetical protein [Actinomadura sp. HBU206391]|uniref:hypothetical protein n=1 Tax=Actinomadura sp. HBU206391 TaxID=2731692 RepID=UPI001650CB9B|nr:hypothetical protein [Actinomadura sp. HBU206391]MBC6459778.1 hypothetical protein [Actinomadura sp. HBU206391]
METPEAREIGETSESETPEAPEMPGTTGVPMLPPMDYVLSAPVAQDGMAGTPDAVRSPDAGGAPGTGPGLGDGRLPNPRPQPPEPAAAVPARPRTSSGASLAQGESPAEEDGPPPLEYIAPMPAAPVRREPPQGTMAGPSSSTSRPATPRRRGARGRHERLAPAKGRSAPGRWRAVVITGVSVLAVAVAALVLTDKGGTDPAPLSDSARAAGPPAAAPDVSSGPSGGVSPTPSGSASPRSPGAVTTESGSHSSAISPSAPASTGPPQRRRPPTGGGAQSGATTKARANLQAFIRGMGHGDASVCDKYATASWATRTYGSMDMCRKDAWNVDEWYRPQEVQAMRTTSVVGSAASGGNVTIAFSDLRWSSGHMTAETVQTRFVLGLVDGTYKIIN